MSTFVCPKLKLVYFDIPGLAEPIRLVCHVAGLPWEDVRLTEEQFDTMKAEGKLTYGQVPVLFINETHQIPQSAAIMRFVGKFAGFYPVDDALLAARIDALLDLDKDMTAGFSFTSDYRADYGFGEVTAEQASAIRGKLAAEYVPNKLKHIEGHLTSSTTGWLLGTPKPTIADFVIANRIRVLQSGTVDHIPSDIVNAFPALLALKEKFYSLPPIKAYYDAKQ